MNRDTIRNLPSLEEPYAIAGEDIESFRTNGHILLREVAKADEMSAYRSVLHEFVHRHNLHKLPLAERETYGKAFIQVGSLRKRSEEARKFVLARRFARIAAELMGVESVRIFEDQALFKEPGGGHTPWHQDQVYWPLDTDRTVTMWIALSPIPAEMGTLSFASGSHRGGLVSELVISDNSHRTLGQYIEDNGLVRVNYGAMAAGDATFHAGWTLHSAPGNPTDSYREVMTIIYMDGDARVSELNETKQFNLELHYPSLKTGDLFDTPHSPIVYWRTQ